MEKAAERYKPGDVVLLLAHGGPQMVVEKVSNNTPATLECIWFDTHHRLRRDILYDIAVRRRFGDVA